MRNLPGREASLPRAAAAALRCGERQSHTHAAAREGAEGLRRWAESLDCPAGYRWWEVTAGASSSVDAHALLAAAAEEATSVEAAETIDAAYLPPVGAFTVFLDDLVDREADRAAGEHSYFDYCDFRRKTRRGT